MDKSAIKNFAVGARVKLKQQIEQKAYAFGITKDEVKDVEMFEDTFEINGNKYNKRLIKHRESLIKKINEKKFEQVIEEVAYNWFNRLIAIRFMEVNEYLPSGIRVLSSIDSSKAEPDIIREAANLDFENLNIDLIYKLQDENNTEELYKYLLIKQCNELGKIMPFVFEEIEDFTELLLPDNLIKEGSIIRDLVTSIAEEDFKEQVEIIGWLYQYYISEKKDEVFADLKKNIKITKENIPAATQLFTPDWIVKYMVENSLGRLWLESHPNDELKVKWKYYLEEAEQEPEVQKQLDGEREKNKNIKPEDIKVIDPCMGSGHILVYQFEVLYDIYKSAGYSEREIPKLILTKNLYGLDIDDRAGQLAYFAVMMKARSYNRRIFREKVDLNICSIQESNDFPKEAIDFLVNPKETEIEKRIHRDDVEYLINVFNDAKGYGSILEVKKIDFYAIERRVEEIRNGDIADIFELQYKNVILEKIPVLIKQANIMSGKYDVVCTNPPYMGSGGMDVKLLNFIKESYPDAKSDMSTVFMEKVLKMCKEQGVIAMINIPVWMFLSSYEKLRENLISSNTFINMIHFGRGVFGSDFGTTAFVISNTNIKNYKATYRKLFKKQGAVDSLEQKEKWFFNGMGCYKINKESFRKIPSSPIAYWISEGVLSAFQNGIKLGSIAEPRQGLATGNDEYFLRNWFEINYSKIGFECNDKEELWSNNKYYVPFNKGGAFRKWYGNNILTIKFDENHYEQLLKSGNHLPSRNFYFNQGITWSALTAASFSGRFCEHGFVFAGKGPMCFPNDKKDIYYILAFLNCKITDYFMAMFSSTTDFNQGPMRNLPIIRGVFDDLVIEKTKQNIDFSKVDWDNYELSWDFKRHPLLKYNEISVDKSCENWMKFTLDQVIKFKANEEELNRIFIEIYKLQDELTFEVEEKDVTIRTADRSGDIKSFISYAVGCMFGRYSLDDEGLIYAGGEFNPGRYKNFRVNLDNVIPITDDEYFEEDTVTRFVEFVKITFSEKTLEENLDYIADTLVKKGNETSRQTIRRYFLKDFYKDHLKIYKKRPIYWLFDSGKNDGFKALIYMHRYDTSTVSRVRTDYLHLLQRKYEAEVNNLDMVMENSNASLREKTEAKKKKEKIQKQIIECIQYDQVIAHVANQKINIDLDEGVKVNYAKFQGVEVPQGEGKKVLKADLLAKI